MPTVILRAEDLPVTTSVFIGRQTELAHLGDLLAGAVRMISVVGAGGIGKTRLAVEALRLHHRDRPVGWIRLSHLDVVTAALAVESAHAGPGNRGVLVLDGCERILSVVHSLVVELLDTTSDLTIVTTSREPIGWDDEHVVRLHGMTSADAAELFWQRAAFVGRAVSDDAHQQALSRRICRHLDHNPLFIRMAATRLQQRPLTVLLAELTGDGRDRRLHWNPGPRTGPDAREAGIAEVIQHSLDLCTPDEVTLLQRLSVFAPSRPPDPPGLIRNAIPLQSAIAVCCDEQLPARRIEALLDRLVDRSLLDVDVHATTAGYLLPETVRVFAANLARGHTKTGRLVDRHREHYFQRTAAVPEIDWGPEQPSWRHCVADLWDNIKAAVHAQTVDSTSIEAVVAELARAFATWIPRPDPDPLQRLLTEILADEDTWNMLTCETTAAVKALLSRIALWQSEHQQARHLLWKAGQLYAPVLNWWARPETDAHLPAALEWTLGMDLLLVQRDPRSLAVLERARRKFTSAGTKRETAACEQLLSLGHAFLADPEEAPKRTRAYLSEDTDPIEANPAWMTMTHTIALARSGRVIEALAYTRELLINPRTAVEPFLARWISIARLIALRAAIATPSAPFEQCERDVLAAELARLGAAIRCTDPTALHLDRIPLLAVEIERALQAATGILGAERVAFERERSDRIHQQYADKGPEQLGAFILHILDEPPDVPQNDCRPRSLTRAELQVAGLVAQGLTNSAIAAKRNCSVRTVDAQVIAIRKKLMVGSRREIGLHIPVDGGAQTYAGRPTPAS